MDRQMAPPVGTAGGVVDFAFGGACCTCSRRLLAQGGGSISSAMSVAGES